MDRHNENHTQVQQHEAAGEAANTAACLQNMAQDMQSIVSRYRQDEVII
ncbi:hypothetical protein WAE56_11570 [Iodobacter sp. LRB]|nr:hypothetical protein [Iodobacter sp. BJB302]